AGPQGPQGQGPPPPPPPAYLGTFVLRIGGSSPYSLVSFAGCSDKVIGVEYEDCHFTIGVVAPGLLQWLSDPVPAAGALRDLTVARIDQFGNEASVTAIGQAFLREFSISDFDAADNSRGSFSIVAVPAAIQLSAGSGSRVLGIRTTPTFLA